MKRFLSYYHPKLPVYLVYMLQQVEYRPGKFLQWIFRAPDLTKVMHRQTLVKTTKAKVLLVILTASQIFYVTLFIWYITFFPQLAVATLVLMPALIILITYLIVLFGWVYIEEPRRNRLLKQATKAFVAHSATKIAISGSYGKTTMKELLSTVLGEGLLVAATPGNKNVPVSHATWVKKLTGAEQVLLIEYGEGVPGDVSKLAKLTHPEYGVITGLAPNHLDEYKTLAAVAKDLLSLGDFVKPEKLFVNADGETFAEHDISRYQAYGRSGVRGWKVESTKVTIEGTSFMLKKGKKKIKVVSGLLGRHQIGPLALTVALADELGLTPQQIEHGIAKTKPFAHRMEPRHQHGAWIVDDTYNGSIEGFRAGLALLAELPAKRKMYVTPGLVDQGEETESVHLEIGQLISRAKPDVVVLMQNSTTQYILKGLEAGKYQGELQIVADPLTFYTNLDQVVASGDLVLMQNDWTDNYS